MGMMESTIPLVITEGLKKELRHSSLHTAVEVTNEGGSTSIINVESILDKYKDVLNNEVIVYELSDEEFVKYKYRPRTFCDDYYNNVDLWGALLRINNMKTSVDFKKKTIKTFGPKFIRVLDELLTIEIDKYGVIKKEMK